jgi:hypothetical protein
MYVFSYLLLGVRLPATDLCHRDDAALSDPARLRLIYLVACRAGTEKNYPLVAPNRGVLPTRSGRSICNQI